MRVIRFAIIIEIRTGIRSKTAILGILFLSRIFPVIEFQLLSILLFLLLLNLRTIFLFFIIENLAHFQISRFISMKPVQSTQERIKTCIWFFRGWVWFRVVLSVRFILVLGRGLGRRNLGDFIRTLILDLHLNLYLYLPFTHFKSTILLFRTKNLFLCGKIFHIIITLLNLFLLGRSTPLSFLIRWRKCWLDWPRLFFTLLVRSIFVLLLGFGLGLELVTLALFHHRRLQYHNFIFLL